MKDKTNHAQELRTAIDGCKATYAVPGPGSVWKKIRITGNLTLPLKNSNVRLVARSFTNLLFTGTADSFLDQMRADLGKALGLEREFTYHSRKITLPHGAGGERIKISDQGRMESWMNWISKTLRGKKLTRKC